MKKTATDCCALCQISNVSNDTAISMLNAGLRVLSIQKDQNTEVGVSTGDGQTATFTIVSPGEDKLEKNLIELGYTHVWTFPRRKGYPEGNLKLYIINL